MAITGGRAVMRNNAKIRDELLNRMDDGADDDGKRSMLGMVLAALIVVSVSIAMITTCSG